MASVEGTSAAVHQLRPRQLSLFLALWRLMMSPSFRMPQFVATVKLLGEASWSTLLVGEQHCTLAKLHHFLREYLAGLQFAMSQILTFDVAKTNAGSSSFPIVCFTSSSSRNDSQERGKPLWQRCSGNVYLPRESFVSRQKASAKDQLWDPPCLRAASGWTTHPSMQDQV